MKKKSDWLLALTLLGLLSALGACGSSPDTAPASPLPSPTPTQPTNPSNSADEGARLILAEIDNGVFNACQRIHQFVGFVDRGIGVHFWHVLSQQVLGFISQGAA